MLGWSCLEGSILIAICVSLLGDARPAYLAATPLKLSPAQVNGTQVCLELLNEVPLSAYCLGNGNGW